MNLENLFKNFCKKNNLEINVYQLAIIDQLKSFYKLNFNQSIFNKLFSKIDFKTSLLFIWWCWCWKNYDPKFFF